MLDVDAGASLLATATAVAALFDAAAAMFLLARSGVAGSLADVVRVLGSRRALAVGACSLLGGPLFMGGYVAAVILAGRRMRWPRPPCIRSSAPFSRGRC